MLAYLTTTGTAPWIVGGLALGITAVVFWVRGGRMSEWMPLFALMGFALAAIATLVLAASRACAGAGGCMH